MDLLVGGKSGCFPSLPGPNPIGKPSASFKLSFPAAAAASVAAYS